MKTQYFLLLVIFIFSCRQDSTMEIKEQSQKIRMILLDSKSLPSTISKPDSIYGKECPPGASEKHPFFYTGIRKTKNSIDTVSMIVTVFDDSLAHISFSEMYFKNDKEDHSYVYEVNKEGLIDYAYRTEGATKVTSENGNTIAINPTISEINLNPTAPEILKKPDKKTFTEYMNRLRVTLDELEKILSAK